MRKDLYLSKSRIHKKGVFTRKPFKKGEIIFILKGDIKKLHIKSNKDSALGPRWIGVGRGTWIDPSGIAQYLNHSCGPNMGIKGRLLFVAIKDIRANDELTFDYSITEGDHFWQFKCNCRARECRKVLRSIQFLPDHVFEKYLPYIPTYFQKVYFKNSRLSSGNG